MSFDSLDHYISLTLLYAMSIISTPVYLLQHILGGHLTQPMGFINSFFLSFSPL